jgi:hypothetical protein
VVPAVRPRLPDPHRRRAARLCGRAEGAALRAGAYLDGQVWRVADFTDQQGCYGLPSTNDVNPPREVALRHGVLSWRLPGKYPAY